MPPSADEAILSALQHFARAVRHDTVLAQRIDAHPEDQLKRSVPELVQSVGGSLGLQCLCCQNPVSTMSDARTLLSRSMVCSLVTLS